MRQFSHSAEENMSNKIPYSVVLADDHALFRSGLKRILVEGCGLEVVCEAGGGAELLKFLTTIRICPDLAILDISMPDLNGIDTAAKIKAAYPEMKMLILSMHQEKEYVARALSVGVNGYLLKTNADADLFEAIEQIRQGKTYISPLLYDEVLS
jgi:DNA-binding NarL/FixJ family response regulator